MQHNLIKTKHSTVELHSPTWANPVRCQDIPTTGRSYWVVLPSLSGDVWVSPPLKMFCTLVVCFPDYHHNPGGRYGDHQTDVFWIVSWSLRPKLTSCPASPVLERLQPTAWQHAVRRTHYCGSWQVSDALPGKRVCCEEWLLRNPSTRWRSPVRGKTRCYRDEKEPAPCCSSDPYAGCNAVQLSNTPKVSSFLVRIRFAVRNWRWLAICTYVRRSRPFKWSVCWLCLRSLTSEVSWCRVWSSAQMHPHLGNWLRNAGSLGRCASSDMLASQLSHKHPGLTHPPFRAT